jgi:hypothetical protein
LPRSALAPTRYIARLIRPHIPSAPVLPRGRAQHSRGAFSHAHDSAMHQRMTAMNERLISRSGSFTRLNEVMTSLNREGYSADQIQGPLLKRQLTDLIKAARRWPRADNSSGALEASWLQVWRRPLVASSSIRHGTALPTQSHGILRCWNQPPPNLTCSTPAERHGRGRYLKSDSVNTYLAYYFRRNPAPIATFNDFQSERSLQTKGVTPIT